MHPSIQSSDMHPTSLPFRLGVGAFGVAIFLAALALLLGIQAGARQAVGRAAVTSPAGRLRRNVTTRATAAHACLTLLAATWGVGAAIVNVLDQPLVYAVFGTLIGVSQGVDGLLTWNRYLVVHPHLHPSKAKRLFVYGFITCCLVLPYVMGFWVEYAEKAPRTIINVNDPTPRDVFLLAVIFLFFAYLPIHILWDVVMGCAVLTRIQELRLVCAGGKEGRVKWRRGRGEGDEGKGERLTAA